MPAREWRLRITDILNSIAAIQSYVAGMDYDSFEADSKTIDAVVRRFGIIGEAAKHVPDNIRELHPEIPWKQMREMRNIVIHVYFGVKTRIVWQTVHKDLPPLVPLLEALSKGTE
jgi:uncharacterized protein with HEPN domain